jgi:signal transduction histidine kinase/CheY-like chemotaxis protein
VNDTRKQPPGDGPERPLLRACLRGVIAVPLVALSAALRVWPLGDLGLSLAYITFYPTIMVGALFGGITTGLLATALSATVILLWSPTGEPFIHTRSDSLGMVVFVVNCTMISIISEAMHRARTRATEAKEQSDKERKRAEEANRAKSVFLANMSHELRTPLNAVLGFSRLMRNAPDATPEQTQYLDIVLRSGEHLLNLINNVLDISKIESGRVPLEDVDFDLHGLLGEVQSLMYARATERKLTFTLETSPNLPRHITADAGKLRQVLINLVGNAIKFTPSGAVVVRAAVAPSEAPQATRLRFEVEDSGPGVREEDRERLFHPFAQLGRQTVGEAGTGLGLVISKQYVEIMGGWIGMRSAPVRGAVFHFEIPAAIPALPSSRFQDPVAIGRVQALAPEQPRYRLLIGEDQPANRLLLRRLLEPLGFEIREAATGSEVIEVFHEWHPQLIWMDIRMPDMDGMEATRRIKSTERGAHVPIIALTAHALEEERREILAAGCDDFLRKPYRDSEIFDALERHLHVRFLYADRPPALQPEEVDATRLKSLPPDLVEALREAAILLDGRRCIELAARIRDVDPAAGDRVLLMLEGLQYKELLVLLDDVLARSNA